MKSLAGCAVAVLGLQRTVSAQLVLNLATVALPLPFDIEFLIVLVIVDFVRRPMLPLVLLSVGGRAGLILVGLTPTTTILSVGHLDLLIGRTLVPRCG